MSPRKPNSMEPVWLADFSQTMRIFTVIVMTEMMVIVYSLSFLSLDAHYFNQLAVLSLLAQLVAITLILVIHLMHHWLNALGVIKGLAVLVTTTVILTSVYTQFLAWVDHALGFGLIGDANVLNIKITLATLMTLMALIRYFYVQAQWAWQLEVRAQSEINALQARIKPHFLYNSLNSIASLIAIDGPAAEKAVLNLSSLFRKAFAKKRNHAPLRQELEWVAEYVAIEKLRFADRLQYKEQIDPALLEQEVPVLAIQPLIENAILHGVEPSSQASEVVLTIKAIQDKLQVTVVNPYHPDHQSQGSGTAVDNIKKRLALKYGDKATLTQHKQDQQHITQLELPL